LNWFLKAKAAVPASLRSSLKKKLQSAQESLRCTGFKKSFRQASDTFDLTETYTLLEMNYFMDRGYDAKRLTGFNGIVRYYNGIVDQNCITLLPCPKQD